MRKRRMRMLGVLAVMMSCVLLDSSAFGALVYDNFDRADSDSLGSTQTTDGATSYAWNDGGVSTVSIASNKLAFADYSGTHGAAVGSFTVADASISLDLVTLNEAKPTGVVYRARTEAIARDIYATDRNSGTSEDAYSVQVWGGPSAITRVMLYRDGGIAFDQQGLNISLASPKTMVLSFEDNKHIVTIDGTEIVNYTDDSGSEFSDAGYVGIASAYTAATVDNFVVSAIPEPCTLGLIAFGGLMVLKRKYR